MSSRFLERTAGMLAASMLALAGMVALAGTAQAYDRPDAWVTMKAKLALMLADGVDGTDIDVDTINHRVTLHGAVDSAAEKSAAERVVRSIEGVEDVRNMLQVVPEEARKRHQEAQEQKNDRLEEQVEDVVEQWNEKGVDVEVESVKDGVVVLDGDVDSLTRYVSLVEHVKRIPGVRHVDSRVEVPDDFREPAGWRGRNANAEYKNDTKEGDRRDVFEDLWITTAVKTKLLANGEVPALSINVDTWNGDVTLFGVVGTEAAKQRAAAEARDVKGVRKVRNELQVVPESVEKATEEKDEALEGRIEKAFDAREGLDEVEVEVVNGVARLTGEVDSVMARLSAAQLARSVKGVKSVLNDIRLNATT